VLFDCLFDKCAGSWIVAKGALFYKVEHQNVGCIPISYPAMHLHELHIYNFFLYGDDPSLCIKKMHTAFIYFIYSTWQKALQQSYKMKPPKEGVKAPPY
jgi:hypothetical protein